MVHPCRFYHKTIVSKDSGETKDFFPIKKAQDSTCFSHAKGFRVSQYAANVLVSPPLRLSAFF
jgi:hypothetical protein